jgi:predicted nucleic acid-binding protein
MKISDALIGVKLLCLDTAPLIYLVERFAAYLDKVRTIIERIDRGDIEGVSSVITLTEVLTLPLRLKKTSLEQEYRNILLESRYFDLIPVNLAIAERAADLRARYNLKTPDALQVATAIETGCDAFLTNDTGVKRVTELRILVLDELELDLPHEAQ